MVLKEIFEKHILEESKKLYIFPLSKILTLKTSVIFKCFKFVHIGFTHTALAVISLSCICVIYMRGTDRDKNSVYHTRALPTEIHTQRNHCSLTYYFICN